MASDGQDQSAVHVPAGWEPIAEICDRIQADQPEMTERVIARIRRELASYADPATVPAEDLREAVDGNLAMVLTATAQQRGPSATDLAFARELGRRRAIQGAPIEALLEACFVGYRELWSELIAQARDEPHTRDLLLNAAGTVWQWVHELTHAIGQSYDEHARQRTAQTGAMRERLFQSLFTGALDGEQLAATATSLGFDSRGRFLAIALAAPGPAAELADRTTAAVRGEPGVIHAVARGDSLYVLSQGASTDRLLAVVSRLEPRAILGIGVTRAGLRGAHLSMGDAEHALALALRRGGVSHFEQDWLLATLLVSERRLGDLLATGIAAARANQEMAATLQAFAARFSLSAAARELGVHVNTVAYRLTRWQELTGWDARTFDGLARSLAALELVSESRRPEAAREE